MQLESFADNFFDCAAAWRENGSWNTICMRLRSGRALRQGIEPRAIETDRAGRLLQPQERQAERGFA